MRKIRNIDLNILFIAIALFLTLSPYFIWGINSILNPILCVVVGYAFFLNRGLFLDGVNYKYLVIFFFFIILLYLFTGKTNIFGLIVSLSLLFVPFGNKLFTKKLTNYFTFIYAIVIGLASVSWILLLLNIISPIATIAPLNANDFDYYTVYPLFMVVSNSNGLFGSLRFSGPFDEAGVIGSVSALLLCVDGFDFKKWKTYIYLISGFFSLSLFFFIAVFTYGIAHFVIVKRSYLNLIILVGLFVGFYFATKDNHVLSHTLWERLEWDSTEGKIAGEDRMTAEADLFYNEKRGSYEYWFGLKNYDSYWKLARGGCSYKNVVMKNGMLFFSLYVLMFLIIAWRNKQSIYSFALFCFLFLAMLYQRPNLFQPAWVFLFSYFARGNIVKDQIIIENV